MKRILSVAAISVIGGILAHVGIFYLVRIEPPQPRPMPEDPARFDYLGDLGVSSDPVLRQQAILFDSSPLFMPTRWNLVSEMADVASLREATEVFSLYPAELSLPETPPEIEIPTLSADLRENIALPDGPEFLLSRFGRSPVEFPNALESAPSIRVFRLDSKADPGRRVEPLPMPLRESAPQTLWTPARFYLQVVQGKALGVPAIAQSSGFSDWDQALQDYIGGLEFYRILASGYYRITVYP